MKSRAVRGISMQIMEIIRNAIYGKKKNMKDFELDATAAAAISSSELNYNLYECVSNGLTRFGPGVATSIFSNLGWMFNIKVDEIPQKPDVFETCLDYIFGSGSDYVKKEIADQLKAKFGFTEDYTNLKDYFDAAVTASKRVTPVISRQ